MGESYLTGLGATTEFASGVQFWNQYGRLLYNASVGQVQYNGSYANGTARPKPVLRTTGQSRIQNSQISWALGFFGPSFYEAVDPTLSAFGNGSLFDVVVIPEGGTENNTLASYDSCFRDLVADVGWVANRYRLRLGAAICADNAADILATTSYSTNTFPVILDQQLLGCRSMYRKVSSSTSTTR